MSIPEQAAHYWRSEHGELVIGGLSVSRIAACYGTPLFVYDCAVIERKIAALRNALPASFSISYSVKANPNPAILRIFLQGGCGLEIASAGEFRISRSAGCPPAAVIFAGPGKTEAELEYVISQGIGEIHVESELEIERISAISNKFGVRTKIAVRVNPGEEGQGGAMLMGGKSAPFGIDEEDLPEITKRIANHPNLDFSGIHLFVGTQILDQQLLLKQYEKGLQTFRSAVAIAGRALRTLDFGGGLGIPYFAGESEIDLAQLREGLRKLISGIGDEACFAQVKFMLEPGRFLIGEAGLYVARINDIKVSRGKQYLILDGGMNHHLAASGNLGQIVRRNFPMAILNKIDLFASDTVDVVGPLCTPLDTLGRSVQLPSAQVGDLIGIFQSGAYARTASPLGFLSHPNPPEVMVEDGEHHLIRKRVAAEDCVEDAAQITSGVSVY
jgi:diaminopimelate decarboxylase